TLVTITVKDAANNSTTCSADITVVDTTPPSITTCATNRSVSANGTCIGHIPDLTGEIVATDNCTASGSLTITQSPAANTAEALGSTTTVTITVKDAANNSTTCTADNTILQKTPPSITTCATNRNVSANGTCKLRKPAW